MDEHQTEVQVETYRPLSPAPEVEIDRETVALRDPKTGELYAANRAELVAALGVQTG